LVQDGTQARVQAQGIWTLRLWERALSHQKDRYRRVDGKIVYIPDEDDQAPETGDGREVMKAHVKGHIRVVNGHVVWIKDHEDKRAGRVAKLHERTVLGQHKTKGHYLRATDKDDAATIAKTIERVTGRKAEKWVGQAKHHGETGSFAHFKVQDAEEGARVLAALADTPEAAEEVQPGLFGEEETASLSPAPAATAPASTNPPVVYAMSHVPSAPFSTLGAGKEVYFTPSDYAVSKGPFQQGAEYVRGVVVSQRLKRQGDPYDEDRVTIAYHGGKKSVRRSKVVLPEALFPVAEKDRATWQAAENRRQAEKAPAAAPAPAPAPAVKEGPKDGDRSSDGLVFHDGRWHREDGKEPVSMETWKNPDAGTEGRIIKNETTGKFHAAIQDMDSGEMIGVHICPTMESASAWLKEQMGKDAHKVQDAPADAPAAARDLADEHHGEAPATPQEVEEAEARICKKGDGWGFRVFKTGEKAAQGPYPDRATAISSAINNRRASLVAKLEDLRLCSDGSVEQILEARQPAAEPTYSGIIITPKNVQVLKRGDVMVDGAGKEYAFWDARYDTVTAHPIVDGKPQVSSTTKTLFWIAPDKTPPGEAYRTDPIFQGYAAPPADAPASPASPEPSASVQPEGPKDGDERQINGRTYRLTDGRWRRVGEDGKMERLGRNGWTSKTAEEEAAPPAPTAPVVEAPEATAPPAPHETPAAPDTTGPAAFRQRLTLQEPEGSDFDKKYGTTYVLQDGEKVAKLSKWHRTTDGATLYGINDLKERKRRAAFGTDPGQIVQPCESLDDAMDKYAMDLFTQEQDRLAKAAQKKERAALIRAQKKSRAIAGATPATRAEVTRALEDEPEVPQPAPEPEPYDFTPEKTLFEQGDISQFVPDYTQAIPLRMSLADRKTILDGRRPSYIPVVSTDWFGRCGNRLEGVKVGEDRYLITVDRPRGERMGAYESGADKKTYALVNLTGLVTTQDFYTKRQKAILDQELGRAQKAQDVAAKVMRWMDTNGVKDAEPALEELLPDLTKDQRDLAHHVAKTGMNEYRVFSRGKTLEQYLEVMKKDLAARVKKKMPKTMGSDKMTYSHQAMIQAAFPDAKGRLAWTRFHEYLDDLKQGSSDMAIQLEETGSTYAKGKETSYGRGGAKNYLLESHGVVVKRQNGDEITPMEVEEVKKALDDVYSVIGDRSSLAKRTGLLISHAGVVLQHARRALGLYMPGRTAIGVTWAEGAQGAGFTMAHEFAHFMDNRIGIQGGRHHYASDDQTSIENRIARTFRKHMAEQQKSDYQNRTCECFARALEQYFGASTGHPISNPEGNHPTEENFAKHIQPLVAEFLSTRGPLLKTLQVLARPA
jgi:hypothetical protein